jgi:hypothetical protein
MQRAPSHPQGGPPKTAEERVRAGASGCASFVTMVESADLRQLNHRTQFRRLNRALMGSVFGKRKMSA